MNKNRNITKLQIENEMINVLEQAKASNSEITIAFWNRVSKYKIKPIIRLYGNFNNFINEYEILKDHNNKFFISKDMVKNDIIKKLKTILKSNI